jgi:hypothetical protein
MTMKEDSNEPAQENEGMIKIIYLAVKFNLISSDH